MDIDKLKTKRQLNVQEQNALERHEMRQFAIDYRNGNNFYRWVRAALQAGGLNPDTGILLYCSTVPCGGNEESARAFWLTYEKLFYELEATTILGEETLVSLDIVKDITAETAIDAHVPGKGKTFGYLALEVLEELAEG